MDLEKLFAYLQTEGKIELTDGFKAQLQETFKIALAEKTAEIDKMVKASEESAKKIVELTEALTKVKETVMEDVKKEVETYKESLVEKLDSFLDSELKTLIPENLVEAEAKLQIYEPLVEGFKSTISSFGIKIDSEGHALLKDAKTEIERLAEDVNVKTVEYQKLEESAGKLLAKITLMEKTKGLTPEQEEKINVIFAGKSADEINEKFDSIRNLIITEKKDEVVPPVVVPPVVVTESVTIESKPELVEDLGQKYI